MTYCPQCGAQAGESHKFCAVCGVSLSSPAPALPAAAVARRDFAPHVKLLAVILIVWGSLGLLASLAVFFALGPVSAFLVRMVGIGAPLSFLHTVLVSLAWLLLLLSAMTVAAGAGLLDYKPWARWLAVAVCVLALLRFPLGTAVGIYGLWVLVSAEGERHYRSEAASRGW